MGGMAYCGGGGGVSSMGRAVQVSHGGVHRLAHATREGWQSRQDTWRPLDGTIDRLVGANAIAPTSHPFCLPLPAADVAAEGAPHRGR